MKRILFYTNVPAPYRRDFFALWGESSELTVLYDFRRASDRDAKWKTKKRGSYREVFLSEGKESPREEILNGFRAIRVLRQNRYDAVVIGTHGTHSAKILMAYMRMKGIPYILNLDGMLTDDIHKKGRMNTFLRSILFQGAALYLVTNAETEKYLERMGVSRERMRRYHFTSVSVSELETDIDREAAKEKISCHAERMVLSVGRFIPLKGFDILIRAMEGIDAALYIVGGKTNGDYEALAARYGVTRIRFIPFMEKDALFDFYRAADAYVMPSRHDVWGLVLNEAMAKGLPLVATDHCGGGLEMIQNGENGFLVPVDDIGAMRDAIRKILADDALRARMGRRNEAIARQYTIEQMVQDHKDIMQEYFTSSTAAASG